MIAIMNADGTIDHKSGSTVSGGTFTITSTPSATVKIDEAGVYVDALLYTFTGGNASGYVNGTVATTAPQSIAATAQNVGVDGHAPMRIGDNATMGCTGTLDAAPPVPSSPVSGALVEVSDAGQDSVEGD